jgi:hypothetical protein
MISCIPWVHMRRVYATRRRRVVSDRVRCLLNFFCSCSLTPSSPLALSGCVLRTRHQEIAGQYGHKLIPITNTITFFKINFNSFVWPRNFLHLLPDLSAPSPLQFASLRLVWAVCEIFHLPTIRVAPICIFLHLTLSFCAPSSFSHPPAVRFTFDWALCIVLRLTLLCSGTRRLLPPLYASFWPICIFLHLPRLHLGLGDLSQPPAVRFTFNWALCIVPHPTLPCMGLCDLSHPQPSVSCSTGPSASSFASCYFIWGPGVSFHPSTPC